MCDTAYRSYCMCLLALDLCLVDLRHCRIVVPLEACKGAVHVCQALMRMQHCDICGGNCSVLASHNAICNLAHVLLHSIDACGLAAGHHASAATFAPDVLFAVTGSFVHAHAVVVDAVRFAAFIDVSPVLPGTGIQNTQSGIMQLRECQCTSSLRFGCFIVGSAIIDCRHISNSHLQHCAVILSQYALLTSSTAGGVCGAIVLKPGGRCTAPPRSTPASTQKGTGTVVTRFYKLKLSHSRPVRCSSDNTTNC